MDLTDQQWHLLEPLFKEPSLQSSRGRPPLNSRPILDGILWKIRTAVPWADLPTCYPSHQTCFRRYRLWHRTGTLNEIFSALFTDLLHRGEFDPQHALRDGSITITFQENRYQIFVKSDLLDKWELSTALVFIQLALTRLKQQPSRTLTTS